MEERRRSIFVISGLSVLALFLLGSGILALALTPSKSLEEPSVPPVITYQGLLSDEGGDPLTGRYTMTFGLYSVSDGGEPLWMETQPVTATSGLFNVYLGATHTLSETLFDGQNLYLGVAVGTDDEMRPRTRVASVPYAFTAGQVLTATCDLVGLEECDGQCVNTQTDRNHCGRCNQACEGGYICEGGSCVLYCPPGLIECYGRCVDPNVDPNNCSACGWICGDDAPICSYGTCAPCP